MDISKKIRAARRKKGLSQRELGLKTGISLGAIQGYEQGRYKPKIEQLTRLSEALGISISDLDPDTYSKFTLEERNLSDAIYHLSQDTITEKDLNVITAFVHSEQFKELERRDGGFSAVRRKRLSYCFEQLNSDGQTKLVTYAEDLARIPIYKKDPENK